MHAHWWASDFADMPWLPSYADPPFPQVIAGMFKQAWPRALEVLGDHLAPKYREFGERYPSIVQWFMDEATHEPHRSSTATSGWTTCSSRRTSAMRP